ncbi:MAG: AAA family ATPase [Lentisphaeria bacterium]|nr:AAA family ATPase [Lentisphaeria bacterium]
MDTDIIQKLEELSNYHQQIKEEVAKCIVGQEEVVEQVLVSLLAKGHCLLMGVPGLAKTLLVSSLGQVLDLDFNRVQFTPDLMPSDITGTEILDEVSGSIKRELRFVQGPVFTNLLLADEINRTPPKTQAALLEAMQEHHVTAGGERRNLPQPFFVLATQNPIEQEGTYPLPEAQLDRFMFLVRMEYPKRFEEIEILRQTTGRSKPDLGAIIDAEKILMLQDVVRDIPVSDHILTYAADLVRATRPEEPDALEFIQQNLSWGAGPRAGQYLILAAKVSAALEGRINVSCADVRKYIHPILGHRISCNFHASSEGLDTYQIIDQLLATVEEPSDS